MTLWILTGASARRFKNNFLADFGPGAVVDLALLGATNLLRYFQ